MPFTLISGTFHVVGKEPDGDSLQFLPKNHAILASLPGKKFKLKPGKPVQLRFEAIDALEIHYNQGHSDLDHQPDGLAFAARDFMLKELGISVQKWTGERGVRAAQAKDGTQGYILSRTFEQNGRPVSFVFAGSAPGNDGDQVHLNAARLRKSANYRLIAAGLVYPTYYEGLFFDLRDEFTAASKAARKLAAPTVWGSDTTNSGAAAGTLKKAVQSLVLANAILPKLFRRIATFYKDPGNKTLTASRFKLYMQAHPDPVLYLPKNQFTNLDTFVEVKNGKVRLAVPPEELVFRENAAVSKARSG